jgi:hypothetical protein
VPFKPEPSAQSAGGAAGGAYGLLAGGGAIFLAGIVLTFVAKTGYVWYGALVAGLGMMARAFQRLQAAPAREPQPLDAVGTGPYREAALPTVAPEPVRTDAETPSPVPFSTMLALAGGFLVALVAGILLGPGTPNGAAPQVARTAWMGPTALMVPFVALLALLVARARSRRAEGAPDDRSGWLATWALVLVGVFYSSFLIDKLLIELSPHWSQKHVIASYFQKRKDASEPLIAWQLYWRGENFYTKNSIYKDPDPNEKTVFLGDHNAEKLQKYFETHAGRRVFFVVERTRFESLRQLLPAAARSTLTVVDDSNNKVYLASANI